MVKLKKQISIILTLSLFLSLIPNFLYNEEGEVFADEISCPKGCEKEYDEKTEHWVCINCPIPCEIGGKTFTNKSCLPLDWNGADEWTCGKEIPIGEVMDRTTYLASRILTEFRGIVEGGREMADKTDELLTDYEDWSCQDCQTRCYKRYFITAGVRQSECEQPEEWDPEINTSKVVYPEECNNDYTQYIPCAEYCAEEEHKERCCWPEFKEIEVPDPEHPGEAIIKTITCKYCRKEGSDPETGKPYCREKCDPYSCMGCCWQQYFGPIINGYTGIKGLQEALENDIKGTNSPKKFKRSYILEQLDFSRCELAQCWIPAEDYYDVLVGKKVGKHLLTCESVTQMGLFDDDQIACLVFQIINEWEEIVDLWEAMGEAPSWQKPLIFFEIVGKAIVTTGRILWYMIKEWTDTGQEEGCYPTNYYCCEL